MPPRDRSRERRRKRRVFGKGNDLVGIEKDSQNTAEQCPSKNRDERREAQDCQAKNQDQRQQCPGRDDEMLSEARQHSRSLEFTRLAEQPKTDQRQQERRDGGPQRFPGMLKQIGA